MRKRVFAAGFRYRLHVRKLPGTPDLVLPRYRVVVFVHGCFWHGHDCPKGKLPVTNGILAGKCSSIDRDSSEKLEAAAVVTIWSCRLKEGTESLLALLKEAQGL